MSNSLFNTIKKLFVISVLLCFQSHGFSQTFSYNWAHDMGTLGPGSAIINGSCTDDQNHYYAVGKISGTVDADPSPSYYFVNGGRVSNALNGFFAEYDSAGMLLRAICIGGVGGKTILESIAVDQNGDILIAGNFKDSTCLEPNNPTNTIYPIGTSNTGDGFLAKYDNALNLIWLQTFVCINNFIINKIEIDVLNNIIVAGEYDYSVDLDPSANAHLISSYPAGTIFPDAFLAKYDANGLFQWGKSLGSTASDALADITIDGNSNIFIGVNFAGTVAYVDSVYLAGSAYDNFMCISKFDSNGQLIWNKDISGTGTSDNIQLYDIESNAQGEVFFTGTMNGSFYFQYSNIYRGCGTGVGCDFLAKLNLQGNCVWAHSAYGDPSVGQSICLDDSSHIFLAGAFTGTKDFDYELPAANLSSTPSTAANYYLASYDSSGVYRWAGKIPTSGTADLRMNNNDKIWMEGDFYGAVDFDPGSGNNTINPPASTSFVSNYSKNGNYQNAFAFKGCGSQKEKVTALDSKNPNIILAAGMFSGEVDFDLSSSENVLISAADSSGYLAAYTASGALIWAKVIFGKVLLNSIVSDNNGNIMTTGYFVGTVDFDPSAAVNNKTSTGNSNDIFMAKYDATGALLWVHQFSSAYGDEGRSITLDQGGNIILTGIFNTYVDFDPSSTGVFALTTPQYTTNGFVAKYDSNGNFIFAFKMPSTLSNKVKTDLNNNIIVNGTLEGFGNFNVNGGNAIVYATGGSGDVDYFLAKYDSSGNYQWAFKVGSDTDDYYPSDIQVDNAGNIYFSGFIISQYDTVDIDPSATIQPVIGNASVLAKYSPSGNLQWGFGAGFRGPTRLALDQNANVNVAAAYWGTQDVDPGPAVVNFNAPVYSTVALRYSSVGQYLNGQAYSAGTNISPLCIAVNDSNQVLIGGQYAGNIDFDLAPGNQNLFLNSGTATNTNGFLLSLNQSNYLAQIPPAAAFNANSTGICEGVCINFQDNSMYAPNAWAWSFPGGNPATSISQNPQNICYAAAGQYDVQLIVSNMLGSDTLIMSNYITAYNIPTTNAGNDIALCEGASVQLNGSGATSYTWSPATNLSNNNTANPVANPAATITYTLTGANGTCATTDDVVVTVNPNPAAPVISLVSGELESTVAFSYQWFYNGLPITGATYQSYFPAQTGNYSVTVFDSTGCYASSAPYTVTVVGINAKKRNADEYKLLPNPVQGAIIIYSPTEKNSVNIILYDLRGRKIATQSTQFSQGNNLVNIAIAGLAEGMYQLQISDENKTQTLMMLKTK